MTIRAAMIALDRALTGRPEQDATQTANNQSAFFDDPAHFLESGGYYLSDGGYSRVVFDPVSFVFRLSSVSRDEVKRRWSEDPIVKAAAGAATAAVVEALKALDPDFPIP